MYKFKMKMFKGEPIEFDLKRWQATRRGLPNGDYEIIIRQAKEWDTERMRKYLHGPALKHVRDCERESGSSKSVQIIKHELKLLYGPREESKIGAKVVQKLKSTNDYTRAEYIQFLSDVDAFCKDEYQCGLPPAEEVE